MEDICDEIFAFIEILSEMKQTISGIHFEATPYDVTECIDTRKEQSNGASITPAKITQNYLTSCDPRSNFKQSLEIIDCLSNALKSFLDK